MPPLVTRTQLGEPGLEGRGAVGDCGPDGATGEHTGYPRPSSPGAVSTSTGAGPGAHSEPLGGGVATPPDPAAQPYSESLDKSQESGNAYVCGAWVVQGTCPSGHRYAKKIRCGREWCSDCGADGSHQHQVRISRWLPKVRKMESVAYLVIEWPTVSRRKLRTKAAISETGRRVKGAMVALGYSRGLRRWHWFGQDGVNGYNPHLNLLLDGGFLSPVALERVKMYLRTVLDEPNLIVHYSYRVTPAEKWHSLKYITRSTFLEQSWDPEMADRLFGCHTTSSWGKWDAPDVWDVTDLGGQADGADEPDGAAGDTLHVAEVESLHAGCCPACGDTLTWTRKRDLRAEARELFGVPESVVGPFGFGVLSDESRHRVHDVLRRGATVEALKWIARQRPTVPDLVPACLLEMQGGQSLGAGYYRLPDLVAVEDMPNTKYEGRTISWHR